MKYLIFLILIKSLISTGDDTLATNLQGRLSSTTLHTNMLKNTYKSQTKNLISTPILAFEIDYKGDIGLKSSYTEQNSPNKHNVTTDLRFNLELKQNFDSSHIFVDIKSIFDTSDTTRRYTEINDLYYKYEFENSDILIGRNTRFWGAMEFYNHTDMFNTQDILDDISDKDMKLGSNNIAYSYYFENSDLSIIAKIGEEKQTVANDIFPFPYSDSLHSSNSIYNPTVYIKYSGYLDQTDYTLIYVHGYDDKRYLEDIGGIFHQNIYEVDKLMSYASFIHNDTIYKSELSLTKTHNSKVSNYIASSVGLEHTLYGVVDNIDLGLLAEYYHYYELDDTKLGAKDLSITFDNDISVGFRISMNDISSSEILGGFILDMNHQDNTFFIKYDTRVDNKYKLGFTLNKTNTNNNYNDLISLEFGYYF